MNNSPRLRSAGPRAAGLLVAAAVAVALTAASAQADVTGPADPLGTLPTSTGIIGPATLGGAITQSQILARADDWMNQEVLYSTAQGTDGDGPDWNYWSDSATGGPYRQDCSGFVSMAWGLSSSLATPTLPDVSTVTDSNISGDLSLEPGDALDYTADHVVLFDHWVDSSGDFAYDAEHTQGQVTNQTQSSVYDTSLEGYSIGDFEALRYNNVTASAATSPMTDVAHSTVVAPNGDLYKFARGADGTLRMWVSNFTSGWTESDESLGGSIASAPSVLIAPNGSMYVYATGSDGTLRQWVSNFTSGWTVSDQSLGGSIKGSPSEVVAPNKSLYVYATGTDGTLRQWVSDFTNGWTVSAQSLGGSLASSPTELVAPNGSLYLYATGTDGTLRQWVSDFTSGWTASAQSLGGSLGSSPSELVAPNGSLYLYATGTDGTLRQWVSNFTSGWTVSDQSLGGSLTGAESELVAPNKSLYLYGTGTDGTLRQWVSDFTNGWTVSDQSLGGDNTEQ